MNTVTFKKQELLDLGLPSECEGGEVLEDNIVGHRRWSVDHELYFRLDSQPPGQAYRVEYSVAATESQGERPWEDEDVVEATVVRRVSVVAYAWRDLDAPDPPPLAVPPAVEVPPEVAREAHEYELHRGDAGTIAVFDMGPPLVEHVEKVHAPRCEGSCPICEGNLFDCAVCGGAEGSLPTECPGQPMTEEQAEAVMAAKADFFGGRWYRRSTSGEAWGSSATEPPWQPQRPHEVAEQLLKGARASHPDLVGAVLVPRGTKLRFVKVGFDGPALPPGFELPSGASSVLAELGAFFWATMGAGWQLRLEREGALAAAVGRPLLSSEVAGQPEVSWAPGVREEEPRPSRDAARVRCPACGNDDPRKMEAREFAERRRGVLEFDRASGCVRLDWEDEHVDDSEFGLRLACLAERDGGARCNRQFAYPRGWSTGYGAT